MPKNQPLISKTYAENSTNFVDATCRAHRSPTIGALSLALNLALTGVFILMVIRFVEKAMTPLMLSIYYSAHPGRRNSTQRY